MGVRTSIVLKIAAVERNILSQARQCVSSSRFGESEIVILILCQKLDEGGAGERRAVKNVVEGDGGMVKMGCPVVKRWRD
jgi:hypothetical protein